MIAGDAVVHTVDLAAPPEAVFAMFTEAERLTTWLGLSAEADPRPGGVFRFEVAPGSHCEGVYVVVEPPTHVAFTWGWTDPSMGVPPGTSSVDVVLEATGDGTRLRLVHDRLPGAMRLLHDDGWTRFCQRLAAVAAGAQPQTYPSETPAERRASLARRNDAAGGGRR